MLPDDHRTIDFFAEDALPAPHIAPAEAELIAAEHLDMTARAQALGSQQDANFLLHADDGTPATILKIANPAFGTTEIEAQDAAADLIASARPELRIATVLRRPRRLPAAHDGGHRERSGRRAPAAPPARRHALGTTTSVPDNGGGHGHDRRKGQHRPARLPAPGP